VGTAVLVTGDTYEKKAKLLAVGRGPCRNAVQTSASWLSRGSCQCVFAWLAVAWPSLACYHPFSATANGVGGGQPRVNVFAANVTRLRCPHPAFLRSRRP